MFLSFLFKNTSALTNNLHTPDNVRVIAALNAMTADALPDHKWEVYGGSLTAPEFRLIGRDGAYEKGRIDTKFYNALQDGLEKAGLSASGSAMALSSRSTPSHHHRHPVIYNADADFLEKRAGVIKNHIRQALAVSEPQSPTAPPLFSKSARAALAAAAGKTPWRKSTAAQNAQPPDTVGFQTSQGSYYRYDARQGTTERLKLSHGHGRGQWQDSAMCLFVNPDDFADRRLALIQQDARYVMGCQLPDQSYQILRGDTITIPPGGSAVILFMNRTTDELLDVMPAEKAPRVGLQPIETVYLPNGTVMKHVGNEIITLHTDKPSFEAAAAYSLQDLHDRIAAHRAAKQHQPPQPQSTPPPANPFMKKKTP